MKKTLTLVMGLLSAAITVAQTPTSSAEQRRRDQLYSPLDPAALVTGVLLDRAAVACDPARFDGTQDSAGTYRDWLSLYTAYYFGAAQREALPHPEAVPTAPTTGETSVALRLVHFRYDRLRADALTRNLIRVDTVAGRAYDVAGRTASPYEQGRMLALALPLARYESDHLTFRLTAADVLGNVPTTGAAIRVDAGDGQGFRAVEWGQNLTATYPTRGPKVVRLRWTQNGHTWQAATTVLLRTTVAGPDFKLPVAAAHAGATIGSVGPLPGWPGQTEAGRARCYVARGVGNTTNKVCKPLIFVEGVDFGPTASPAG